MKVTIVGGGNVGTQFATHFAEHGDSVYIRTSKPDKFSKDLIVVDHNDQIIHKGRITKATSSDREAFENADLVFVTVPSFMMQKVADQVEPYVNKGMMIGIIPGNGGGEFAFKESIHKGAIVFGLQRVPSVARLIEYGKKVCATGYRKELKVASIPKKYVTKISRIISEVFGLPCLPVEDYMNLTLAPSNPILHTTRLYTLFKNYVPNKIIYKKVPLFYEDWDNQTTKLLFKCDEEVQSLCNAIKEYDLSEVKSLKVHYENDTVDGFTHKIQSIEGFKGLPTPVLKITEGYIPDIKSRYFTADFNYGLRIIIQIADLFKVEMPNCKKIYDWYNKIKDPSFGEFSLKKYRILSKYDLLSFYI